MIEEGVYYEMTDEEYHKQHTYEEHSFSSSQLKTMIEGGPVEFHDQYILGNKKTPSNQLQDAYDVGTVTHTAVLEPHLLKDTYVKWTGGNRVGKEWKEFKLDNAGKIILNKNMLKAANTAIKNVRGSKLCSELFVDGESEVSFFVEFMGLRVKVRTDWLQNTGKIVDLKTANGNVRDETEIKGKIKKLAYDLSAAFYVDVVNYCIDYFELDIPYIDEFLWVFTSKDSKSVQAYSADEYMELGRAKYKRAIAMILKNEEEGWSFPEEIKRPRPSGWEINEWIEKPNNQAAEEEEAAELL